MAMLQGTWLSVWMAPKEGQRTAPTKLSSVAMATRASTFAWADLEASGASRGAAAVASHAAAASFRSNRSGAAVSRPSRVGSGLFGFLSGGAAWSTQPSDVGHLGSDLLPGLSFCASLDQIQTESRPSLSDASTKPLDGDPSDNVYSFDDNVPLEDRRVAVTYEDVESEEAILALYERWCKTFNKKRDNPVEKALRFEIFRDIAMRVLNWNTYLPEDPKEAAIYLEKKRKAAVGEDDDEVQLTDDWYEDMFLGIGADGGGDPIDSLFWGYLDSGTMETRPIFQSQLSP